MQDDPLYTPQQAGLYLGGEIKPIPVSTLAWWRVVGRGPKYEKCGRSVRYRKSHLDAFREASVRDPVNPA